MNDLDIVRELEARAADVHDAPDLAARARRRAARIRTRRRVGVGLAALTALAVAIPTGMTVVTALRDGPVERRPEIARTPTPTQGPTSTVTLDLSALPAGDAPSIGWVEGTTFHRADNVDVALPGRISDLVSQGAHGAVGFDWSIEEIWFSGGGTTPGRGPAVSPDGFLLAWSYDEEGAAGIAVSPAYGPGGGDRSKVVELSAGERVEPVGFLGDSVLVSNVVSADGLALGARVDDFAGHTTGPWDVEMVSAVSEASGLVAGRLSVSDDGSCWAVLRAGGGTSWEQCDFSLDHFSQDGRFLLAGPAYRDGLGDTTAAVLDARTGSVLLRIQMPRGAFLADTAFEDDGTVLLSAHDAGAWAIVRCDLGGACERASNLVEAADVDAPFGFGRQP
jgi:hypothetical protein